MNPAYLLVAHGSRDPRSQVALTRLGYQVSQCLESLSPVRPVLSGYKPTMETGPTLTLLPPQPPDYAYPVQTATLEGHPQPLHQQIMALVQALNCTTLRLLPLFLQAGVHVQEDLPREIALAQAALGSVCDFDCLPYLGHDTFLESLLRQAGERYPQAQPILLAHGSRRADGNLAPQQRAQALQAKVAYWSLAPNLTTVVEASIQNGSEEVLILPYFLFSGGITDQLASQVAHLQHQYPQVRFHLGNPLAHHPHFAFLLAQLLHL
ncbi:sirohydrochlorin chelatase [Synechocystis sp. LKSZ1]|uniref:sirohydrochlorin chelatase n=1 Tax=Synechocystis sp. LKSZ1 TaxID=3144951 RepID=UPI00336BD661